MTAGVVALCNTRPSAVMLLIMEYQEILVIQLHQSFIYSLWNIYFITTFSMDGGSYSAESASWWRHQMERVSALLAICAGNSSVTGEFPTQRPVTRNFDVFFDLHPNKRLSKQWWGWWFETQSCPLWRHSNDGSQTCLGILWWRWWCLDCWRCIIWCII